MASEQGGIQTSLSPHCVGVEGRWAKLGDRMLTAFLGGLQVDSLGCRGGVPTAHGGWKTLGISGREQESGHTVTGEGLPIPLAWWDAVTWTWQ